MKNTAKEMGVNVSDINAQLATVRKEIEKTRINAAMVGINESEIKIIMEERGK